MDALLALVGHLESYHFFDASAFEDVVLAATGFWGEERQLLRQVASLARLQHGGALVKGRTTHLVARSPAAAQRSEKLAKAGEWGVPVVNLQWLVDSIAEGRPLPAGGGYQVVELPGAEEQQRPRRQKQEAKQPEQRHGPGHARGRSQLPAPPRPSSVASNQLPAETGQREGAAGAQSPGRQALGPVENMVAGLHQLSVSPKPGVAAAGGAAGGTPCEGSPEAVGSPQRSLSLQHLVGVLPRSPSSSPAAVSSRLVEQGRGLRGTWHAAGQGSPLPEASPMLASPFVVQQPIEQHNPEEAAPMCSSPGDSVASYPGSAPYGPSPALPSDCSTGAGSPEGLQHSPWSPADSMRLGGQAPELHTGREAEQLGGRRAARSPHSQQALFTESKGEFSDDGRPAVQPTSAGIRTWGRAQQGQELAAWGSPDVPLATPASPPHASAADLDGKGALPSPGNLLAVPSLEMQQQRGCSGNSEWQVPAGGNASPAPSEPEASLLEQGRAASGSNPCSALRQLPLPSSNQGGPAQKQPKHVKGIQDWTDDDSGDDFPTPCDPRKGRAADQGSEPVIIARPPPAVPSLKGDTVALKLLQRAPRANCVREHHGLKTLKQVQFAEQVQVKGAGLVLSTKDKKTAVKLRTQRAGDAEEEGEEDDKGCGGSLQAVAVLGEVAAFYRLPDGEWFVEFYQLYTAQQAEVLAQERGVRFALPPGYDRANELLKSTARQCAALADVLGAITVRRVKQGGTLLKLKGEPSTSARSYFCRASLALDPAKMRLVTDAPVTEFVAAD